MHGPPYRNWERCGIRTRELVALLNLDPGSTRILKRATHLHEEEVVAGV